MTDTPERPSKPIKQNFKGKLIPKVSNVEDDNGKTETNAEITYSFMNYSKPIKIHLLNAKEMTQALDEIELKFKVSRNDIFY